MPSSKKRITLTILNDTTDTCSDDASQSCCIVQGLLVQPHQVTISTTKFDDDFYVAKLNEQLYEEILEVLKIFVDNNFQRKGLEDQEFKFKYYHISFDDNPKLEVTVFLVAKSLLPWLN